MAATSTPWAKAFERQTARRHAAKAYTAAMTEELKELKRLAAGLGHLSTSTYDTVAVAYLADPKMLLACIKREQETDVPSIRGYLVTGSFQTTLPDVQWSQTSVLTEIETNLHAEMAIVKQLLSYGLQKTELKDRSLQIYCDKGVCSDCSGWLIKYGIPHMELRKTPANAGWTGVSGGNFFRSGNDLAYTKHQVTLSKGKQG